MKCCAKALATIGLAWMPMLAEGAEAAPSADELFSIVNAARTSASSERILDPGLYSRENLEHTLRNIDAASRKAHTDGLDWERDALLTGLAGLTSFDAVYSLTLSPTHVDSVGLRMQVTNCGRPSVETIGFRLEDGRWRMHSFNFDGTEKATSWYYDGLKPIQSWAHIQGRERSRYFNESDIGKALGLNLAPKKDDCS